MIRCARCKRELRNPITWAGLTFGETCAKAVGAAAAMKAAKVKSKRARVHVEASEFDERQLTLNLEVSYV